MATQGQVRPHGLPLHAEWTGPHGRMGKILLDGVDVSHAIRGITIRAVAGELNEVVLYVIPSKLTVDMPVLREYLTVLSTPPPGSP